MIQILSFYLFLTGLNIPWSRSWTYHPKTRLLLRFHISDHWKFFLFLHHSTIFEDTNDTLSSVKLISRKSFTALYLHKHHFSSPVNLPEVLYNSLLTQKLFFCYRLPNSFFLESLTFSEPLSNTQRHTAVPSSLIYGTSQPKKDPAEAVPATYLSSR